MKIKQILSATVLFLALLSNSAVANEYPIPAPEAKWGQLYFEAIGIGLTPLYYYNYYGHDLRPHTGDTTIDAKVYTRWDGYYTRYEDGRVYVIDTLEGDIRASLYEGNGITDTLTKFDEVVLYDFNLETGDSIVFPFSDPFNKYMYVTEHGVYTVNGQERRRLKLKVKLDKCSVEREFEWIEGIGDVTVGVFYHLTAWYCLDPNFRNNTPSRLICFSDASGEVYNVGDLPYFENLNCNTVDGFYQSGETGLSTDNSAATTVLNTYPSPVHDALTIKTDISIQQSEIYTIDGNNLQVTAKSKTVDCSSLLPGMYMLKVIFVDGTTSVALFVKE